MSSKLAVRARVLGPAPSSANPASSLAAAIREVELQEPANPLTATSEPGTWRIALDDARVVNRPGQTALPPNRPRKVLSEKIAEIEAAGFHPIHQLSVESGRIRVLAQSHGRMVELILRDPRVG